MRQTDGDVHTPIGCPRAARNRRGVERHNTVRTLCAAGRAGAHPRPDDLSAAAPIAAPIKTEREAHGASLSLTWTPCERPPRLHRRRGWHRRFLLFLRLLHH